MTGNAKLSARSVAAAKPGRHGDGHGLYLAVSGTGARKWVFWFTFGGRVTEMGLGNAAVTPAQARDKAAEARKLVASGVNRKGITNRENRQSKPQENRALCPAFLPKQLFGQEPIRPTSKPFWVTLCWHRGGP